MKIILNVLFFLIKLFFNAQCNIFINVLDALDLPCHKTLEYFIMFTDKLDESRRGHARYHRRKKSMQGLRLGDEST